MIWSNLRFFVTGAGQRLVNSVPMHAHISGDNWITYRNPKLKSAHLQMLNQMLMSELANTVYNILPRYRWHLSNKLREKVLAQQKKQYNNLINNLQKNQSKEWGKVKAAGSENYIIARDKYGRVVPESLMLYYNDAKTHTVEDVKEIVDAVTQETNYKKITYTTNTICHIDLAPQVSVSSNKNIVITPVVGRDSSRKELVSGGDLEFEVQGVIVGNDMGVYPQQQVTKFIQIMQYKGIVDVNFFMFDQLNVHHVIIKGFSLEPSEYKNEQPYRFSCVGIEPEDEVVIESDTISAVNKELSTTELTGWYKFMLDNKWGEIISDNVMNATADAVMSGAGIGIDELMSHI